MDGFQKRTAKIREKMIQTTLAMLQTWDPERIRIADIAKEAKVSQVTIYNYFGSKEKLMHEAAKHYIEEAIAEFMGYMQGDDSVKNKIEKLMLQKRETNRSINPDWAAKLLLQDEELADYARQINHEVVYPALLSLFEEGKKSGDISSHLSAQALMMFLQMFQSQSAMLLQLLQNKQTDVLDELVHMFFYGISGKP